MFTAIVHLFTCRRARSMRVDRVETTHTYVRPRVSACPVRFLIYVHIDRQIHNVAVTRVHVPVACEEEKGYQRGERATSRQGLERATRSMPKIVGGLSRVVDDGHGLTIDELTGNVATKEDTLSIAMVKIAAPTAEPWLTLHYDEWMCVLKGRVVLKFDDGNSELEVKGGQTVFIGKGERFKPEFPDAGTEYIPVAIPAFRPDRCIREDGNSEVSQMVLSRSLARSLWISLGLHDDHNDMNMSAHDILDRLCSPQLYPATSP